MARLHTETIPTSTLAATARGVDGFVTTQTDHQGITGTFTRAYTAAGITRTAKDGIWYTYGWNLTKKAPDGCKGDCTNTQLLPEGARSREAAPSQVFGSDGSIKTAYTYTPYGAVTATGNVTQPIRWSSEYNDSELGLVYYNYRHYNPADGRWISRDIAEDLNNLTVYVSNSSIKTSDSLGLICHETNKDVCGPDVTYWLERTMRNDFWHPLVQTSREHNQWALWIPFFNWGWIGRTLAEFYSLVKTNGPWDYKNSVSFDMPECPSKSQSCKLGVTLCGHCLLKEVIGDIHYGWIGRAAGIRSFILLQGADIYQSGGLDEPHEVAAMKIGIVFFERGGNLCNYVRGRLSSLKATGVRDLKACRPCYARFS